jgi:peroxiredoxin
MVKRFLLRSLFAAALLLLATALVSPASALMEISVGMAPPPFALPDRGEKTVSLEYLAGHPGVLVFWSTWSPRSAEILEDMSVYHRRYAAEGLRIVAINVDGENLDRRRGEEIRLYTEERDPPFKVLFDRNLEAFAAYGVMAHPSAVVINREGRISYTLGGYPPSLRDELRDNLLKVLDLYVETVVTDLPGEGHVPADGALQHYYLGLSLLEKGQPERALSAFREATGRDPSFIEPAVMTARLSLAAGEIDKAEDFLRSVDPEAINRSDIRFLLGMMMLLRDRGDAAEKVFQRLEERYPGEAWGKWGLGLVALSRDDWPGAAAAMKEASSLQPANLEAASYLRSHLVSYWRRGSPAPSEDDLVLLFPGLEELRDRYRRMFRPSEPVD